MDLIEEINKDSNAILIKAFLEKNNKTSGYHIPDFKEDIFQIIFSLVCDLETEHEVAEFIKHFLDNKICSWRSCTNGACNCFQEYNIYVGLFQIVWISNVQKGFSCWLYQILSLAQDYQSSKFKIEIERQI